MPEKFTYIPNNYMLLKNALLILKSEVSMEKICQFYGININRSNKALCPFHNDVHNSMHIYSNNFYCFSCGAHGNIIDFVQHYFKLNSFSEALGKINNDFNLNLQIESNKIENDNTNNLKIKERIEKLEAQKLKREKLKAKYDKWLNLYIMLDKIILNNKNRKSYQDFDNDYFCALKNIDFVCDKLQDAEIELKAFERKEY